VQARPRLVEPDRIELRDLRGAYRGEFRAGTILLAPSTRPLRPLRLGGRGRNVMTTSDLTSRAALPADVAVIGAGFTGLRTARLLAQLGCQVTLYEERSGAELTSERAWLDRSGAGSIKLRDGTEILAAEEPAAGRVSLIALDGTRREHSAAVLAVGRYAFTAAWNLPQAGVGLDPRGRIWCDRQGRTWAAGVYACGEAVVEAGGGCDDAGQIEAALEAVRARVEESSGRRAAATIG
jgi:pyruvate/2-oxoglutarate dehydrogenase complex dihydrolipoamide dehydrogenase (E3) component